MAKANYVGANRGDIQYVPPPSSALSASPTTGYAKQAQYIGPDQIHAVDSGYPAPKYEKGTVQQVETVNSNQSYVKEVEKEKKPNVIVRLWRHFLRHWIFYGILLIIFLAIFLPVFFLVAFPAIAQLMVDKAALPIYNAQIMDPTPQSIVYSMNGSLNVPKPFSVRLEPVTLSLFIDEGLPQIKPYVEVGLFYPDGKTLKGNATLSIDNQRAEIKDGPEFVRFLESAVYNEKFWMSARGQSTAWVGKLKAKLKLNKKIELKGLNMLKGFNINSARVVLPPDEDGTNFIGNITLPNSSDVTFEMGNVTLNLKVGGLIVGHATILDVFLVPGNNYVEARGTANLRTLIANLPHILAAEAQAISKGNIELQASGNKTVYNGQSIFFFEEVLNKLELSAQMPILKLLLDSAGGLLGDITGGGNGTGGGLGGLLGGMGGKNITETLQGVNVTDLIPLLLGPETENNSNGNSSLLSLLGKRVSKGFQKRNTELTQLDIPVTVSKLSDSVSRRREASAVAAASGPHSHRVARQVKRFAQSENHDALVALFRSEKGNIVSWLAESFESPEAGSIADTLLTALLEGRSAKAKRAEKVEKVEAVGAPLRRRQNVSLKSHDDVVAAIMAKERINKRAAPGPALERLAFVRGVARNGIAGIAGNAVAARSAPPLEKRRNRKNHREVVATLLSKKEALDRFGAAVNVFGKRAITNLKTRDLEIAAPFSNLVEVAKRREDAKRGQLDTRANAPVVVKGRTFSKGELLGRFAVTVRSFAKRSMNTIQGRAVAAEAVPSPGAYKRKRNTKSGREIVDSILSKREALDRFGVAVNGFGKRAITNLKTRDINFETSRLDALVEVARRHEDAKRGEVGKRAEIPVVIKGTPYHLDELLGRFGTAVRSFTKTGMTLVVGHGAAAASAPPPLEKRRNQKNHREVVAAILSKNDALDRFGSVVNSFGKRALANLKTRDLNLDTTHLQAVKEIAKRREDAKRASLDTRSDAPVVVKGRAFAKGELLGRFTLTVRGFAKRGIDVVQGHAVAAASSPPPLEKRRNQKNHREVVAAILSKKDALGRFGSVLNSFGKRAIINLKTRDLNIDTSKLQTVKDIAKRREDEKRAVLDTRSDAPVIVKGRAFAKGELLGRFALTVRGFAKRSMDVVQGRAVAAASTPPPFEKRRNQKNHREVVAALLSKKDALDRFGSVVRGFGMKGINNLKTRELYLDTSKLVAVKEGAKRREDAKRASLDTRADAPIVVKGRAFAKGELLGRFALTVRSFAKRGMDTIQGREVAAENIKTPRVEVDGEDASDDDDFEELEVEDEKVLLPVEELPNPLAAWSNIGAVLQQRNTLALLGNVAGLLAKNQGLKKRDLDGGNGGAEAAAAVALGLTDVHKVMPLLMTNSKALEAFGKLTANKEIREVWAKLSESPEAQDIWNTFVKGREQADAAAGAS